MVSAALAAVSDGLDAQSWDEKKVSEICEKPQYGYTESAKNDPVGPKFLRITDIQNGKVNWESMPYCICSDEDLAKYRVQPHDIFFARTGATTGKNALIQECSEAVFASYLIRLRPRQGTNPAYIYWFFQSSRYWSQVYEGTIGSAQPNMNGTKLASLRVPFPPDKEQRRIVAYLDSVQAEVDAIRAAQATTQKELDALMPSVLAKAFAGEL